MKTGHIAAFLLAATAFGIGLAPWQGSTGAATRPAAITPNPAVTPAEPPRIDVVFVLDTTSSMSGLIASAKEKIWSIATNMSSARPAPEIRMGLVAYRDRGDAYVTRVVNLSTDLDSMYATLMDFKAQGGGDGPESVNRALHDAVHRIAWSQDPDTYKVIFLVGDAPPHMDYPNDVGYPRTLRAAADRGIVVNAVQCGQSPDTARVWQQVARLGLGRYFQVGRSGDAVAVETPYDEELAALSARLDETRLYYGDEARKHEQSLKRAASEKLHAVSSLASRARRAIFNATRSGEANLLGEGELVDDIADGRVTLEDLDAPQLPESMQSMAPAERRSLIERTARQRRELKTRIEALAQTRADYIEKELAEAGGAEQSLDAKIFGAVREQAAGKGLHYDLDRLSY